VLVSKRMNNTKDGATAGETIKHSVQKAVHQSAEAVDSIKVRVVEITDQAKSRGSDLYGRAAAVIKAKPFQSVAIAFGVGYLAMRINTSKLTPLAVIGALGYFGTQILRGK
jgi:ElaB/YqjD/DUF883 family membrane-anchored ribosome-binding protein